MTPSEMEEAIKNLNARTSTIEQILPTLATKDDLRLTTQALQHEIETGFQEAKNHADRLNEVTREQIRFVAAGVQGVAADVQGLGREMATKGDLQQLQRALKQSSALRAPGRKKR